MAMTELCLIEESKLDAVRAAADAVWSPSYAKQLDDGSWIVSGGDCATHYSDGNCCNPAAETLTKKEMTRTKHSSLIVNDRGLFVLETFDDKDKAGSSVYVRIGRKAARTWLKKHGYKKRVKSIMQGRDLVERRKRLLASVAPEDVPF